MRTLFIAVASFSILLSACGSNEEKKKEEKAKDTPKESVQDCYYEYDATTTHMEWEAFKYIDPAGVKGTFNNVIVSGTERSNSIQGVFKSASFEIPVASVNSNNPDRDGKIQEHFFGTLSNTEKITGSLKSWEGNKGILSVTMNESTQDVPVTIEIKEDSVKLSGEVDMKNFNGMEAINALNTICKDLHTGPGDSESKLWSNVKIRLATKIKKDCQ